MGMSWSHILIALMVFMLLFGSGKISGLMTDLAKGIKSFKMGLADDEDARTESAPKFIENRHPQKAGRTDPARSLGHSHFVASVRHSYEPRGHPGQRRR
jgi:sec-independent protein translocase protein TatA